ncbi:MAG: pyridoxal phosphate-dependent aminotransferase [Syntrophomonadaceae bacterium]|jgi:aspartate/methionine/tyrosine aminotransferase|nr:pyridoxal phosphate-dependent aminotransferase [Syntrophomonadaceae bacterium]
MINEGINSRTEKISSFIVMDVLEEAKQMEAQGRDIIHLEIGEPDFDTPEPIIESALTAIKGQDTHYTHSLGKIELREEIASYYFRKYGVEISPEQIVVTSGTSPALLLILSVLLNRADEIILSDPYYSCYPNFINYLEGKPVLVPVMEEDNFQYRLEDVKKAISSRTRAIMCNSPANPTGTVMSAEELRQLAGLGHTIVADEIYHGLVYEGEEHSILEFADKAFVVNGFSKLYAMTGWRLGYVIVPPSYLKTIQKLQQNLFICASSFSQTAAIAALKYCDPHVLQMKEIYNQRRKYLLKRLERAGIKCQAEPTGAFYILANVKKYTQDSYNFAFNILKQAGVAVAPGIDFGSNCEGYLRISYANSLDNIEEGMNRLEAFLAQWEQESTP